MVDWIRNFVRWIRGIFFWVQEPKEFYLHFFTFILIFFYGFFMPHLLLDASTELETRITGLAFQLWGIGTVALGLHRARKLFGRPSLRQIAKSWWNRRPRLKPGVINLSAHSASQAAGSGKISFADLTPLAPSRNIDERVAWLERNLVWLHQHVKETQKQNEGRFESFTKDLHIEQSERSLGDQIVKNKLEEFSVGGIHLETFGVVCLFLEPSCLPFQMKSQEYS